MSPNGTSFNPQEYGALQQRVQNLCADVEALTESVERLSRKVDDLSNVISEAKGGWRVLMAVSGAAATISGVLTWLLSNPKG